MPLIELNSEMKSVLLFSGTGIVAGGMSSMIGSAPVSGAAGIGVLYALRKSAMKMFGFDAGVVMQFGVMPYLAFWYMVWVLAINL